MMLIIGDESAAPPNSVILGYYPPPTPHSLKFFLNEPLSKRCSNHTIDYQQTLLYYLYVCTNIKTKFPNLHCNGKL